MHNPEINRAYKHLLYYDLIVDQSDIVTAMRVSKSLVSEVLGGKKAATDFFITRFEEKVLKPNQLKLSQFKKPVKLASLPDVMSFKPYVVNRLAYIEIWCETISNQLIAMSGGTEEQQLQLKKKIAAKVKAMAQVIELSDI